MPELPEIRVRLAMVGPAHAGKSSALAAFHEQIRPDQRSSLTQFQNRAGKTIYYDHAEFELGKVAGLPIVIDLYALPGEPEAELARRIIMSGCDGYLFTADSRDYSMGVARNALSWFTGYLAERNRNPRDAAVIALLTHDEKGRSTSNRVEVALRKHFAKERIYRISSENREPVVEAIKQAAALALSRERDALEARRSGKPPPRIALPVQLEADVDLAHRLYLRAASSAGPGFSPHSEQFFSQVLLDLGASTAEDLQEGIRLLAQAVDLELAVSLEEILLKRGMVDPELLPRAKRVKACIEVIHEEILFGRTATELGVVPFERVKGALGLQVKRKFAYSLDHLLTRLGQLNRADRAKIQAKVLQAHRGELERDHAQLMSGVVHHTTPTPIATESLPFFGEVAVNLGMVTPAQVQECVTEQEQLRREGIQRFIGDIMRRRGYLQSDEIPLICKALEDEIADDRVEGYHILRSLGRGNMALVFAARQINLDRIVALKILDPKLLFDGDFISRFLEEARAAARLNHPNMVQAYDVGSCRDLHYFAMEFVDGVTVKDLIEDSGGLDEETTIDIVVQTARALDHAARHKLVHRDVKPGNVMVNRDGVAKLCDLGLAKRTDQTEGDESVILGSPYYISPEQIQGRADIDIRADIYSLGATLFHMITGRPPFTGRTPEDVCLKHLSDPLPASSRDRFSKELFAVLKKMMAKDRDSRHASAADVVRDLVAIQPSAGSDERQHMLADQIGAMYPQTGRWKVMK